MEDLRLTPNSPSRFRKILTATIEVAVATGAALLGLAGCVALLVALVLGEVIVPRNVLTSMIMGGPSILGLVPIAYLLHSRSLKPGSKPRRFRFSGDLLCLVWILWTAFLVPIGAGFGDYFENERGYGGQLFIFLMHLPLGAVPLLSPYIFSAGLGAFAGAAFHGTLWAMRCRQSRSSDGTFKDVALEFMDEAKAVRRFSRKTRLANFGALFAIGYYFYLFPIVFDLQKPAYHWGFEHFEVSPGGEMVDFRFSPKPRYSYCRPYMGSYYFEPEQWVFRVWKPLCKWWTLRTLRLPENEEAAVKREWRGLGY